MKWEAFPPQDWPPPPARMSYSTLGQIEACPRRWALQHADYSDRGFGRGYPDRPSTATVLGRAVHCALDRVARAVDAVGSSTPDAVIGQLRALGGLSSLVAGCLTQELDRLRANPRALSRLEGLEVVVRQHTPELRLLVQSALSLGARYGQDVHPPTRQGAARGALGYGYHPEVELAPDGLAWIGYADAIRLTSDACEIVDYKTGSPSPGHGEQLRLYALLWSRDTVVNPSGRLADHLRLIYPSGGCDVAAPNAAELEVLAAELAQRASAAAEAVTEIPPKAVPTADGCRFCDVKPLCSDFWTPAGQAAIATQPPPQYRSVQGVIFERIAPSTVAFIVEHDPYLQSGTRTVLTHLNSAGWQVGDRVRLLDVRVGFEPEVEEPVITFGRASELFRVP